MNVAARRRLSFVALLVLVGAAAVFSLTQFRVESSMTLLLPPTANNKAALARQIVDSNVSRTMLLSIGPKTTTSGSPSDTGRRVRQLAKQLALQLRNDPGVATVLEGPDPDFERDVYDLYFPRRFNFIEDDTDRLAKRLSQSGLEQQARQLRQRLSEPSGVLIRKVAAKDPLLAFPAQVERLETARPRRLRVVDKQFMSDDGHALIFLTLRDSALDGTKQSKLLDRIDGYFGSHQTTHGDFILERSGINVFAVDSENRIKSDVILISTLSISGILILFGFLFRSARALVMVCIPLATALVVALATTLAAFGEVHAMTLAFGSALLGVCIDFPIHLITHATESRTLSRSVRSGLLLSGVTTMVGILALAGSGFEVLQQIALFSTTGLLVALLVTLFVLPSWTGPAQPILLHNVLASALERRVLLVQRPSAVWGLVIIGALVGFAGLGHASWSGTLEELAPISEHLKLEDSRVRARVGTSASDGLAVAVGTTEAEALKNNQVAYAELEALKAEGAIRDFQSLHAFIWPPDIQRANVKALADKSVARGLSNALEREGFDVGSFATFFEQQKRVDATPLTLADLGSSSLRSIIAGLVLQTPPRIAILSPLTGVADLAKVERRLDTHAGVQFVNQKQLLDEAYHDLLTRVRQLIGVGALGVGLLVLLRVRRWRAALATFLPGMMAPVMALGLLGLAGRELNLFHLFAALVVFSMAVDYGVMLNETATCATSTLARAPGTVASPKVGTNGITLLSTLITAATTCMSFGMLAISAVPALTAIGETVAIGVLIAVTSAPIAMALRARPDGVVEA